MLYLIGIGLGNEKDITINAKDAIKDCSLIYLESYTSYLGFDVKRLEKLTKKSIILADRNFVEVENEIIEKAKKENVAFLVKGDVFSATTHVDLFLRAKQNNVECKVLHNASILTAIGDAGLSLYKFGKVVSIPFDNDNIESPYEIFLSNGNNHTLFLLDLIPSEDRFMNFKEAFSYLIKKSNERNDDRINKDTRAVVCAGLCTDKAVIKYGKIKDILKLDIATYPQCVIILGELHFIEEEMISYFKV